MMKKAKIYKITNIETGMCYIGCTCKALPVRFSEHISACRKRPEVKSKFYESIRLHGYKCFIIEELETCEKDSMHEKEKYWIKFLDTYKNGLNSTEGGQGSHGYKHSKQTLIKMSKNTTTLRKNIPYTSLYKEKASLEKEKRANSVKRHWKMLSKEDREKRSLKITESAQKRSKIGIEKIKQIKEAFKKGASTKEVNLMFPEIKSSYLSEIKGGRRWKTA